MATNPKPTTSFYVNYGQLDPMAAQRALAPVIIAPRFALHNEKLGDVGVLDLTKVIVWPGRSEDTKLNIIDFESAKVTASNAEVVLTTGLVFSREAEDIRDAQLDYSGDEVLAIGDRLVFNATEAVIVDIATTTDGVRISVDCDMSSVDVLTADLISGRVVDAVSEVVDGVKFSADGIDCTAGLTINGKELKFGELYVEFREQIIGAELELRSNLHNESADWAGAADSRNPMGMMFAACSGVSDEAFFYMLAVNGNTEKDYIAAINYAGQFEDIYAPICYMQSVGTQAAIRAVIDKYSDPKIARFKRSWFCMPEDYDKVVYRANEKGETLICTVENGALSLTNGDLYRGRVNDGDFAIIGGKRYAIADILGKQSAKLVDDITIAADTAVKFERDYTGTELAKLLATVASNINDKRINFVVGDSFMFNGEAVETSYVCAALATLRCALPPHAPMNDMELPGFTVGNSQGWGDYEYELMNDGGCWVMYRDIEGRTLVYHQITTLTDGTIAEDDSVVSNGDSIVRTLRKAVAHLCGGKGNATQALLDEIRISLCTAFKQIESESYPAIYGPRIVDWNIGKLYIPEGNKRSVMCEADIELPQPTQDSKFVFNLF